MCEMERKRLTRREFIKSATIAGVAVYTAPGVFAMETTKEKGGAEMARFAEVINPPEKEGKEKHVPHIELPETVMFWSALTESMHASTRLMHSYANVNACINMVDALIRKCQCMHQHG